MIPPEDGKCSNCIYFKNKGEEGLSILYGIKSEEERKSAGICTRYPPIPIFFSTSLTQAVVSRSPLTSEGHSCGEWIPDNRR